MLRKTVSWVVLVMLLLGMLTSTFNIQLTEASGTIYIRSDGSIDPITASAFIDSDDNITYYFKRNIHDSIVVERSNITIDGLKHSLEGSGDGIKISAHISYVTVKNIEIKGFFYGIYLVQSSFCNLIENNITQFGAGTGIRLYASHDNLVSGNRIIGGDIVAGVSRNNIFSGNYITEGGIYLENSNNNSIIGNNIQKGKGEGIRGSGSNHIDISENNITNNSKGIRLSRSENSMIYGNNITANTEYGIELSSDTGNTTVSNNNINNNGYGMRFFQSFSNVARDNSLADNHYNFGVEGSSVLHFTHDIDTSNTIAGKPIYYWINKQNMEVPTNAGYVAIVDSRNITVQGLQLKNNRQGILLASTTDSKIIGNHIIENMEGIYLYYSLDNSIYGNYFVNNSRQVNSFNSLSHWNSSYPEGNYWSDYVGVDYYSGPHQNETGSDGIGDAPYVIDDENSDHYPFFTITNNSLTITITGCFGITKPTPGTYNNTARVVVITAIPDSSSSFDYWLLDGEEKTENPIVIVMDNNYTLEAFFRLLADLDESGTVDILDISMVASAFNSEPGDYNWNSIADLNEDQVINILDMARVAIDFGKTCL